jgi:ribosomal protein S18 acetylase RimI-like enzyme
MPLADAAHEPPASREAEPGTSKGGHSANTPPARGEIIVRPAKADDLPFLWDMLFEAAAVSPTMRALGKEAALAQPANQKYLVAWGRPGDAAVVAVDAIGRRYGASWYRLFPKAAPGYGFVAPEIPELTIGVSAAARGQGVGTQLLRSLLDTARAQSFQRLSLSVDRQNPARALYERLGFHDAGISDPDDSSVTLVAIL